jgi:glutamyl-Q tRNA(Asp) synthetase
MPSTGRFAPTPSGPLHFGSLVAALASYCQAKSGGGRWLLRIEDVDTPRVVAGAETQILAALEAFGFEWDGPLLRQNNRFDIYREYLDRLLADGRCYACECSRRSLREQGAASGVLGQIYPGNCRDRGLPPAGHSLRVNTAGAGRIGFRDRVYGEFAMDLEHEVGDFVVRRADGIYAYHLAVVVDDQQQGVDQVVRGADLLENTCLHLYLQRQLGFSTPAYLHLPLVNNVEGVKLSKQTGARAIEPRHAPQTLLAALRHLGQAPAEELQEATAQEILAWAIEHWNPASIPSLPASSAETFDD